MRTKYCLAILFLLFTKASVAAPPVFNVREYGATGLKADDATRAIADAIAAARRAGGGVVELPPGAYRCLGVRLHDHITLQIDAGAVLYVDVANPDFVDKSGFIYAEGAKNIAIVGRGKIDGQAQYEWAEDTTHDPEIASEVEIARKAGVDMKRSYRVGKSAYTVLLKECEGVIIEGVTLENSSLWGARIWGCNRVRVHDVTITSDLKMGVNSDGIDLDGTRNAQVTDCLISTGDDAICLKTGRWKSGEEKTYPTENIIVSNCILTSSSAALKIGSETLAPIRFVLFTNCVIREANRAISINVQDGATVSDIVFSNLTIDLHRRHWNWWGSAEVFSLVLKKRTINSSVGAIKNITIENVTAYAQGTSRVSTLVDKPLENLRIRNLHIVMDPEATPDKRTQDALVLRGIDGLTLDNVTVRWNEQSTEPAWRHALVLEKVDNFRLRGVSARQALPTSTTPALLLTDCTNGTVTESLAQPQSGVFMRIRGSATKNLLLHTNYFGSARQPLQLDDTVSKGAVTYKLFEK